MHLVSDFHCNIIHALRQTGPFQALQTWWHNLRLYDIETLVTLVTVSLEFGGVQLC